MPSIEYDDVYKRALAKINDLDLANYTEEDFREVEKRVNFKVIAKISDKVYESNSTIKLSPDRKEEDNA